MKSLTAAAKSLKSTVYLQVCELHFKPEDIREETSAVDERTGIKITARLQLCKGALPTLLPNCPKYLCSESHRRKSPDSKRQRREENAIKSAIEKSTADAKEYESKSTFNNTEELFEKLQLDKYWTVFKKLTV